MLLNMFQKNEKKDYLKRIGVKFSKDELKIYYSTILFCTTILYADLY